MGMHYLDRQVIEQALAWAEQGECVWLCTVLATYGSSPRAPGAWLAARGDGQSCGSLSGGCVEEDFITRLKVGEFSAPAQIVRYGATAPDATPGVTLPCGGSLEVLVERLPATPVSVAHLAALADALAGQRRLVRQVALTNGQRTLREDDQRGPIVDYRPNEGFVQARIGPARQLVIGGISAVTEPCAAFAVTLGFEVVVCDPDETACQSFGVAGVNVKPQLPARYLASGACHADSAIVALTHDPRMDDLTMMEAVNTPAFYIGVMGSPQTSRTRAERLRRSGGLNEAQLQRIQMPIGLALGSKTPAEIALAVMSDIVRVANGKARDAL